MARRDGRDARDSDKVSLVDMVDMERLSIAQLELRRRYRLSRDPRSTGQKYYGAAYGYQMSNIHAAPAVAIGLCVAER
jgi:hypothetical protein